jgi:hypothetical protein
LGVGRCLGLHLPAGRLPHLLESSRPQCLQPRQVVSFPDPGDYHGVDAAATGVAHPNGSARMAAPMLLPSVACSSPVA